MTPKSLLRVLAIPALFSIVFVGCGDSNSQISPAVVDTTAPGVPSALGVAADDEAISVTWADNSEVDLAGYVLERSLDHGQSWAPVSESALTSPSYTDELLGQAEYRVAAVDVSENLSAFSDEVRYLAPSDGGDGKIPTNPNGS